MFISETTIKQDFIYRTTLLSSNPPIWLKVSKLVQIKMEKSELRKLRQIKRDVKTVFNDDTQSTTNVYTDNTLKLIKTYFICGRAGINTI